MKNNKSTNKSTDKLQDIFVSIVVVARPESEKVDKYITDIFKLLSSSYKNYEIIIVDNNAPAKGMVAVTNLLCQIPCIRIIKLSQQLKYDTAIFAGLEVSIGDYVCTIDPTIDSITEIKSFVTMNQSYDVIQGVSTIPIQGAFGTQVGRRLFYWYNRKYIGIDIPLNATYLASFSRRAINSLTSSGRNHRHIRHLARRIGYGYFAQEYTPIQNPSNQRRFRMGVVEALEIVTSYSTHPLRFVTWLGLIASVINVMYACYVVAINLFVQNLAPGWTSTSMQSSLMFFVLFIIMVILSEYIGRILTESCREPNYLVADELVSTVALADAERRNITK